MAGSDIRVGIDEFTLVLQTIKIDDMKLDEWLEIADEMVMEFRIRSRIERLFGRLEPAETKLQAGYTYGLTYTDEPWYFMISWHDVFVKMGVCVKFSAYAYAAYKQAFRDKYQQDINIVSFLRMVQSKNYTMRLSRIDLTADYFDFPDPLFPNRFLEPDSIYRRLQDGTYKIKNHKGKSTLKTFSALHKDGTYETFYAGSKRGKTDGFLRCYDKKEEQIQTHGFRFREAENCKSWVRFEAVFRHEYAHQISEQLLKKVHTDAELQQAIAKHIVDKYCFYDIALDEPTTFSDALAEIAAGANVAALSSPNARDNSLTQSIEHLIKGSGLFSTLYKVYVIWGDTAESELLQFLIDYYESKYKPKADEKDDIQYWLRKHYRSLKGTTLADSLP